MELIQRLSQELKLRPAQVEAAVRLLDEGNTIPFIARYRKEMTDSLDDAALRDLSDRLEYLRNLQKRREEVIRSITEQEKLTPELETAIQAAATLAEVEDLYRPYKPKRRTRGSIAREKGLEPLAAQLSAGEPTIRDIIAELQKPGRDPRESLPPTVLRSDVLEMKDLKPEMELTGTVRNVVDFGAFVDIGVHEDGLVHISQIGEKYVKHPSEVLKVGDIVRVKVLEVDQKRGRISLTMRRVKQSARL